MSGPIDPGRFIDERRVGPYQLQVVLLCGLVMLIDGFDTQMISYVAPAIAREWHLSKTLLGPIFSSALAGLMVGYLLLSPLSDRFGHKRLIVLATLSLGLFTLLGAWAQNVGQLIALRFVVGLGLGAAAPSAIALTGEYSPRRLRASFVLAIYCGFSLGFVVAGMAAGWLLPAHGWRSTFWAGAIAPLALVPIMTAFLPDSLAFLGRDKGEGRARALAVLRRIDPGLPSGAALAAETEGAAGRSPLAALFREGRTLGTVLLWFVFAVNLAAFYALQNWLPTVLTGLHYPLNTVVAATTLTTVGGIVIAFVVGPAMDRLGAYGSLAILYVAGFACTALLAASLHAAPWLLFAACFLAGCCISGGQKSVIALAAIYYPPAMRSTGVGWALGIGRVGGIAGPLILGALFGLGWTPEAAFYTLAAPMAAMGLAIWIMGRRYARA